MSEIFCKILQFIRQKEFEHALLLLKKLEKKSVLNWYHTYLIGFCYRQLGDHPESIIYYRKSLSILPRQPITINALGISYQKLGQFERAQRCYKKSIDLLNIRYLPKWSSYSITCRTLLAEAFNSLGVVQQLLAEKQNHNRILKRNSLKYHLNALEIECEILNFKLKRPRPAIGTSKGRPDFLSIWTLENRLMSEPSNLTIFLVNYAAQLFRMGDKYFARQLMIYIKSQIDESHPQWGLVGNLLADMCCRRPKG